MGAYTPGLKVTPEALLRLDRRLPLAGTVNAKIGEKVSWDQIVAHTELPGKVDMVNLASKLGLAAAELPRLLLKKEGDSIKKGEVLGYSKGFFGFFKAPYHSPVTGTLESISKATGQVILRGRPRPIEIKAYVDGVVEEVEEGQGVTIKTFGSLIQGIFGLGGETSGELVLATENPNAELPLTALKAEYKNKVVVIGKKASAALVKLSLIHI